MHKTLTPSPRLALFDSLRGLALVLMAIFHFSYDLNEFKVVGIDFNHDPAWLNFRTLIMSMFTLLVGVSFSLGGASFSSRHFRARLARLTACAVLISVTTYFFFGNSWIYFGVLHLFVVASVIGPILLRAPKWNLAVGSALIALPLAYKSDWFNPAPQNILGLASRRPFTEDFAPLAPWLGVIMIGVFIGMIARGRKLNAEWRPLSQLGRHSLLFYMTHQLVLYPLAWLIAKITG